jgi:hypothetical protein
LPEASDSEQIGIAASLAAVTAPTERLRRGQTMRIFRIAGAMAIGSIGFGVASLLLYPGGTYLDRSARGYSFFHNLLSDAGMTVAFSGQPNPVGSMFATFASVLAAAAVIGCAAGLVGVYCSSRAQRRASRTAAALLVMSCVGWVGAVFSPPNRSPLLHMHFATLALGATAAATLSFAVATMRDRRFPRAVPLAWTAVTVMIPALLSARWWAPAVTTDGALMFHAIMQKLVIFGSVGILIYQSRVASRVARSPRTNEQV